MSDTHPCAAVGCATHIPESRVFCREHWARLPLPIQQRIYSHYQTWRTAPPDAAEQMHSELCDSIREAMVYLRNETAVTL